jgi:hypothetical protein
MTPTTGQNVLQVHFSGTADAAVVPVVQPTITGRTQTGHRIVVLPGTWGTAPSTPPAPTALTYQWLRNGVAIPGATSTSYTLTASDVGRTLTVAVTATRPGYVDGHATTAAVTPSRAPILPLLRPYVSGSPRVLSTLTARIGTWSPTPSAVSFQWLRDGRPLTGVASTRSTLALGRTWPGHTVSVRITVSRPGYVPSTVVTAARRVA